MEYKTASREFEAFLVDARDAMSQPTRHAAYTAVEAFLTVFHMRLDPVQAVAFAQLLPPGPSAS